MTTDQLISFRNDLLEHGTARLPLHTDLRAVRRMLALQMIEYDARAIGEWHVFTKRARGAQENCD